jgi:hypothetical protein
VFPDRDRSFSLCWFIGGNVASDFEPAHVGVEVGGGWCGGSPCIEDLAGTSSGFWGSVGFGASVTYFDEGHCKGYLVGAGLGAALGKIKCKSWVTFSSQ